MTFTVTLDNASEKALSLTYSTMAAGTAEQSDFTAITGTLISLLVTYPNLYQ